MAEFSKYGFKNHFDVVNTSRFYYDDINIINLKRDAKDKRKFSYEDSYGNTVSVDMLKDGKADFIINGKKVENLSIDEFAYLISGGDIDSLVTLKKQNKKMIDSYAKGGETNKFSYIAIQTPDNMYAYFFKDEKQAVKLANSGELEDELGDYDFVFGETIYTDEHTIVSGNKQYNEGFLVYVTGYVPFEEGFEIEDISKKDAIKKVYELKEDDERAVGAYYSKINTKDSDSSDWYVDIRGNEFSNYKDDFEFEIGSDYEDDMISYNDGRDVTLMAKGGEAQRIDVFGLGYRIKGKEKAKAEFKAYENIAAVSKKGGDIFKIKDLSDFDKYPEKDWDFAFIVSEEIGRTPIDISRMAKGGELKAIGGKLTKSQITGKEKGKLLDVLYKAKFDAEQAGNKADVTLIEKLISKSIKGADISDSVEFKTIFSEGGNYFGYFNETPDTNLNFQPSYDYAKGGEVADFGYTEDDYRDLLLSERLYNNPYGAFKIYHYESDEFNKVLQEKYDYVKDKDILNDIMDLELEIMWFKSNLSNYAKGGKAGWNWTEKEIRKGANTLAEALTIYEEVPFKVRDVEYEKGKRASFELFAAPYGLSLYYVKANGAMVNPNFTDPYGDGGEIGHIKDSKEKILKKYLSYLDDDYFNKGGEAARGEKLLTKEYKEYLDRLRDSGRTNMFGATPYLEDEFGLSYKDAKQVLVEWMRSFAKGGDLKAKHVLHVDGQNWFLEKIDNTHFYMSNDKDFRGMAHHIGQHRGEPYYEEVRQWLKYTYAKGGVSSRELDKKLAQITLKELIDRGDDFIKIDYDFRTGRTQWTTDIYLSANLRNKIKQKYGERLPRGFAGPETPISIHKLLYPILGQDVYMDDNHVVLGDKTILIIDPIEFETEYNGNRTSLSDVYKKLKDNTDYSKGGKTDKIDIYYAYKKGKAVNVDFRKEDGIIEKINDNEVTIYYPELDFSEIVNSNLVKISIK